MYIYSFIHHPQNNFKEKVAFSHFSVQKQRGAYIKMMIIFFARFPAEQTNHQLTLMSRLMETRNLSVDEIGRRTLPVEPCRRCTSSLPSSCLRGMICACKLLANRTHFRWRAIYSTLKYRNWFMDVDSLWLLLLQWNRIRSTTEQ